MLEPLHLCRLEELEDPGSRGFDGRSIGTPWDFFLVRDGQAVYGYRNNCPHTGAPLDWSPDRFLDLDKSFIQCAIHGALFRMEDGHCLRGPCTGQNLQAIPVRLEDGAILLERQ